ncbi:LAQU0S18e02432g1_1 [Lachancea quebecensis]|uniref:Protein CASP n=1 Tax=Lachancea quebecensis TaxID=1654605 RepID=A0A0P1KWX3_9SACH|nr:LAQU0S18e02432g1_1 [Lachancea quebecensis]
MSDSVFKHAVELWSKANLPELQRQLDESVLTVKELETKSFTSRKALASETKQFKRLDEEHKLAQVNKVIKQYQQEVDSLTSRSKFSEEVLLNLYSKLSETPDPQPLLVASSQQSHSEEEITALKDSITELEHKLSKHADYDKIRARLLDLEQNSAKTLSKRLSAKEQEVNSKWQEKERNWSDREKELVKQLEIARDTNKVLEGKLSQSVDGDDNSADMHGRYSAEHDLLLQEVQSSQVRIMDLERRNEELSGSLAKATSQEEQDSEIKVKSLKINELESENALLSASLERERNLLKSNVKDREGRINKLEQQLDALQDDLNKKARKLEVYADYDSIKKELTALKKIEFGASDDENAGVDSTLLNANKKLQSNLAELRAKFSGMEKERAGLQKEVRSLNDKVSGLEKLNARLELDLEKVDSVSMITDTASMMSGATRQMNRVGTSTRPGGKLSPTSSIVGIPEDEEMPASSGNARILPIVTQQRDRLRQKTTELEKKLRQTSLNQGNLRTEVESLKNDNAKLYERIRFLSSYGSGSNLQIEDDARYSKSYDESLHPLADFKQKELSRYQKKSISPMEKVFLSFAGIVLANKTSRMLFMCYCLGLHGLVMVMIFYVASFSGSMSTGTAGVRTAGARM